MAETTTSNFGWTMPDPGASANTWGATLNATTQKIDQQVYDNQTAATASQAPIGSITMFAGATPPTGWLVCDGRSLATIGTYAALFAVCGYTFGGSGANFNLPSLTGRAPFGASALAGDALGTAGGETTHTLTAAEIPAHAHQIIDMTHSHGVSQTPHGHGDPGHTHGVSEGAGHSHGGVIASGGAINFGGVPSGYSMQAGTTAAATTGISIQVAGTGIQAANANISLGYSGTGLSTTQNTGGGAAHNNMPPFICLYFIIRYQ